MNGKTAIMIPAALLLGALALYSQQGEEEKAPYLIVLGVAQDGGVPHAGSRDRAQWEDPSRKRLAVCLGLVDPAASKRWMIEATPDFREQLYRLDCACPVRAKPGLDGILLTHAHIGHYTGLMFLGHESLGSKEVPVYAMPKMEAFLGKNGPWDQLVRYRNIKAMPLAHGVPVALNKRLTVTPFLVPHRQEYSEVVGFVIEGPSRSVLFIPDIDRWEELDAQGTRIETLIAKVDVAYLDGTFYGDGEIPGRDMSAIPHPLITYSMKRFAPLPPKQREKVRFIHLNHTNPALDPEGEARKAIEAAGFRVADELERVKL